MAIPDYETVMLPLATPERGTRSPARRVQTLRGGAKPAAPDGQATVFRADASDDHGADKGIMITTSGYSPDAIAYTKRDQRRGVILVMVKPWLTLIRFNVGVRLQRAIEVKRVDQDFFDEADTE